MNTSITDRVLQSDEGLFLSQEFVANFIVVNQMKMPKGESFIPPTDKYIYRSQEIKQIFLKTQSPHSHQFWSEFRMGLVDMKKYMKNERETINHLRDGKESFTKLLLFFRGFLESINLCRCNLKDQIV